jgi:tetratricopeptide (TPR) repeat protein
MADKKQVQDGEQGEVILAQAKDFWTRNSKWILGVGTILVLAVGGWFFYKNYVVKPKEEKAAELMWKAEEYFRMDSTRLALTGDGQNLGFLSIISKYGGTDAGNLASYYAGVCYLKQNDNQNAIKYLKKFDSDAKQIQQRAYKLLGDAYGDLGNNKEALEYYKKAAHHFEADRQSSAEALGMAAYFAEKMVKDQKEAIALYTELKQKFPNTDEGRAADKYLARLGVYNVN